MKRKTLFAILFLIMFSSVLSFVNADELDAQLVFPGSDELKEIIDSGISAQSGTLNGQSYNAIYGVEFGWRNGWHDGNYNNYKRNWNDGMPTSNTSAPFPFDKKLTNNPEVIFALGLSSNSSSTLRKYAVAYTAGYCIGWGVPFGDAGMTLNVTNTIMQEYEMSSLNKNRNGEKLSQTEINNVKYVLTYGYEYPVVSASSVNLDSSRTTILDGLHYYGSEIVSGDNQARAQATQYLCWVASAGYIRDNQSLQAIENYFFERNWNGNGNVVRDGVDGFYYEYKNLIQKAMNMPSYSRNTAQEAKEAAIELDWNEANQRFETNVKDTNALNQVPRVQLEYQGQNQSLNFEQQADGSVTIWTRSVVGSQEAPNVFTIKKSINGAKGVAVVSKSKDTAHQPIAVATTGVIEEYANVAVYTQAVKIKVKKELEPIGGNYGDATTKGCEFTIYEDEACTIPVDTIVTDENGNSQKSKYLPYKTYWALETSNNESTERNTQKFVVDPTQATIDEDGDLVFTIKATNQIVSTELRIIKERESKDSTENSPAEGAVLRLTLKSNPKETYVTSVNSTGYAVFENIPYGTYILSEDDSASDVHLEIDEKIIGLTTPSRVVEYKLIIVDKLFRTYVKVQKIDSDTDKPIKLAGAKFKIYNVDEKHFETFKVGADGHNTEVLETNEDGYFITPQQLAGGNYRIYEVEAPKGYYLDEKYRLPDELTDENLAKYGKELKLTKLVPVEETDDNKFIYKTEIADTPLKGKVEIIKTGEKLVGYTEETKTDNKGNEYTVKTPRYEQKPLANVEYTLVAKEDIKSPDGTTVYEKANSKEHKVVTNEDGRAISEELYVGTYKITEVKTELGYVATSDMPDVVITNDDQMEKIKIVTLNEKNPKQQTKISIRKELGESKYKYENIKVAFGLYTDQEIKTYDNKTTVMKKDTLVDVVYAQANPGETVTLSSQVNLPAGKYYFKELYVDYPYTQTEEKYSVEVKYKNTTDEVLEVYGPNVKNEAVTLDKLSMIKLSSSTVITEGKETVKGRLTEEQMNKYLDGMIKWLKLADRKYISEVLQGDKTYEDIQDNLSTAEDKLYMKSLCETKLKTGAIYEIYLDEFLSTPLMYKDGQKATIKTNKRGYGELDDLPLGEYWLKEVQAPTMEYANEEFSFEIDEKLKHIVLTKEDKNQIVYTAFIDVAPFSKYTKNDIFTSELIENCKFEIKDKNGNILVEAITDENGIFEIPLNIFKEGEEYTYTEIDAPEIYEIDTTPHKFTIKFDEEGNIIPTKIENTRKTRKVIVRKVDADTGDPLQGCVFTIALINPETGEQVLNAQTGEPIYLVQNAETDENGEYIIENTPMGTYKFTEIKAPEGYELDEDLTGLVFTVDNNSPETIIFEVTNTGDIAVVALIGISVLCAFGIVYTLKVRKLAK